VAMAWSRGCGDGLSGRRQRWPGRAAAAMALSGGGADCDALQRASSSAGRAPAAQLCSVAPRRDPISYMRACMHGDRMIQPAGLIPLEIAM